MGTRKEGLTGGTGGGGGGKVSGWVERGEGWEKEMGKRKKKRYLKMGAKTMEKGEKERTE